MICSAVADVIGNDYLCRRMDSCPILYLVLRCLRGDFRTPFLLNFVLKFYGCFTKSDISDYIERCN